MTSEVTRDKRMRRLEKGRADKAMWDAEQESKRRYREMFSADYELERLLSLAHNCLHGDFESMEKAQDKESWKCVVSLAPQVIHLWMGLQELAHEHLKGGDA